MLRDKFSFSAFSDIIKTYKSFWRINDTNKKFIVNVNSTVYNYSRLSSLFIYCIEINVA